MSLWSNPGKPQPPPPLNFAQPGPPQLQPGFDDVGQGAMLKLKGTF